MKQCDYYIYACPSWGPVQYDIEKYYNGVLIYKTKLSPIGFASTSSAQIYAYSNLFAKLLSVSVCMDAMPNESVEYIFNGNNGKFELLLKWLMDKQK